MILPITLSIKLNFTNVYFLFQSTHVSLHAATTAHTRGGFSEDAAEVPTDPARNDTSPQLPCTSRPPASCSRTAAMPGVMTLPPSNESSPTSLPLEHVGGHGGSGFKGEHASFTLLAPDLEKEDTVVEEEEEEEEKEEEEPLAEKKECAMKAQSHEVREGKAQDDPSVLHLENEHTGVRLKEDEKKEEEEKKSECAMKAQILEASAGNAKDIDATLGVGKVAARAGEGRGEKRRKIPSEELEEDTTDGRDVLKRTRPTLQ